MRVIYRWRVPAERLSEFIAAWKEVTNEIHATTTGARGSFCLQSVDALDEVLTVALWESEAEWRAFIPTAKSTSMKRLHDIGEQLSATPYRQLGDETV